MPGRSRTPRRRLGAAGAGGATPSQEAARRRVAYAQNFLRDGGAVERALARSSVGAGDVVYEIGPGTGVITDRLARRCRHVVAVEKDPGLVEHLRRRLAHCPNVTVFEGDFLSFPLPATPYKVFANVPFNATAAIVGKLTAARYPPEDTYLAVQREAAERFCGEPSETLVSVLLKPWLEPAVVHRFDRQEFVPAPGVDVVLLRLRKRGPPLVAAAEAQRYRDFVAYAFTAWRPSLRSTLRRLFDVRELAVVRRTVGVDAERTPSSVPFAQWLALYRCFVELAASPGRDLVDGAEARLRRQQAGLEKVHRTRTGRETGAPAVGAGRPRAPRPAARRAAGDGR